MSFDYGKNKKKAEENKAEALELLNKAVEMLGVPPKVAQQLILDAQGINQECKNRSANELAAGWDIASEKMKLFFSQHEEDFPVMKRRLGNAMGAMLALGMDDLMTDMNNPFVMGTQTPEQKSRILKNFADAWMTLMEGQERKQDATVAEMMAGIKVLLAEKEELKKIKGTVVETP